MKKYKTSKLVCLTLALCMLLSILPGTVMATGTAPEIKSPTTGNYLMMGRTVMVEIQSETKPSVTVGEMTLTANPDDANGANGLWSFAWTPQSAGFNVVKAKTDAGTDTANLYVVEMVPALQETVELEEGLAIVPSLAPNSKVFAVAFDASIPENGNLAIEYGSGAETFEWFAYATEEALNGTFEIIVNLEKNQWTIYLDGVPVETGDWTVENFNGFLVSGATVDVSSVEAFRDGELEKSVVITSPVEGTVVMPGDSLTVKVETANIPSGIEVRVSSNTESVVAALEEDGTYTATLSNITEIDTIINAAAGNVSAAPVSLKVLVPYADAASGYTGHAFYDFDSASVGDSLAKDFINADSATIPALSTFEDGHGLAMVPNTYSQGETKLFSSYLNAVDHFSLEADVYMPTNGQLSVSLATNGGYGEKYGDISFKPNYLDSNVNGQWGGITVDAAAGTWHKLKMVVDTKNHTKSIYLNGALMFDGVAFNNQLVAGLGSGRILQRICFYQANGTAIDNLSLKLLAPAPDMGLQITSPANGAVVLEGDSVEVKIRATGVSTDRAIEVFTGTQRVQASLGEDGLYSATLTNITAADATIGASAGGTSAEPVSLTVMDYYTGDDAFTGHAFYDFDSASVGDSLAKDFIASWSATIFGVTTIAGDHGNGQSFLASNQWQGGQGDTQFASDYIKNADILIFEADVYLSASNSKLIVSLVDNGGAGRCQGDASLVPTQIDSNRNGTWGGIKIASVQNQWSKLKMVVDVKNRTKTVYVNDMVMFDKAAWNAKATGALQRIGIYQENGAVIDNLSLKLLVAASAAPDSGEMEEPVADGLTILNPVRDTVYGVGDSAKVFIEAVNVADPIVVSTNTGISATATLKAGTENIYEATLPGLTLEDTKISVNAGEFSDEVLIHVIFVKQWEKFDFEGLKAGDKMEVVDFWGPITIPAVGTVDAEHGTSLKPTSTVVFNAKSLSGNGIGDFITEFEYYLPADGSLTIALWNTGGYTENDVVIDANGVTALFNDPAKNANSSVRTEYKQETNAWHKLKFVTHMKDRTKSVYIDDECVVDRVSYGKSVLSLLQTYALQRISVLGGGNTYVDNMNFRCSDAAAQTTIMKFSSVVIADAAGASLGNTPNAAAIDKILLKFSKQVTNEELDGKVKLLRGNAELPISLWSGSNGVEVKLAGEDYKFSPNAEYTIFIDKNIAATDGTHIEEDVIYSFITAGGDMQIKDSGFKAGDAVLTDITDLNAGDTVSFVATLNRNAAVDAWIIFGVYSENVDGARFLKESVAKKVTLAANTDVSAKVDLTLESAVGENDYIQAMILDATGLHPLRDAIVLGK